MTAAREVRDEVVPGQLEGLRVTMIVPVIPDGAPGPVKDGLSCRRVATLTGECPSCGRRRPKLSSAQRKAIECGRLFYTRRLDVTHQRSCPGHDKHLIPALLKWMRESS